MTQPAMPEGSEPAAALPANNRSLAGQAVARVAANLRAELEKEFGPSLNPAAKGDLVQGSRTVEYGAAVVELRTLTRQCLCLDTLIGQRQGELNKLHEQQNLDDATLRAAGLSRTQIAAQIEEHERRLAQEMKLREVLGRQAAQHGEVLDRAADAAPGAGLDMAPDGERRVFIRGTGLDQTGLGSNFRAVTDHKALSQAAQRSAQFNFADAWAAHERDIGWSDQVKLETTPDGAQAPEAAKAIDKHGNVPDAVKQGADPADPNKGQPAAVKLDSNGRKIAQTPPPEQGFTTAA